MSLSTAIPSAGRSGAPPLRFHRGAVVALISLAASLVFLSPGVTATLQLERERLLAGELWRLVTCHMTHWTGEHLAFDLFAFALLLWLCLQRSVARTAVTLAAAAVAVPLTVLAAHPELTLYRGLSGLDSALFVLLGTLLLREGLRTRRTALTLTAALALVAFAAKVVFELTTGGAVFAASGGFVPVPVAHVAGALVGAAAGVRLPRALRARHAPASRMSERNATLRAPRVSGGWRG